MAVRRRRRVLIVGGGIGGLTAAAALRAAGHEPVVLERARTLEPIGAGISLWPNAVRILRDLGLGEWIARDARRQTRVEVRTTAGRTLSCLDGDELERRAGAPLVVLHRGDLQRMLAAAAGEALVLDTEVTEIDALEDSVSVCAAGGAELEGDVLIGADGLRSIVRRRLFDPSEQTFSGVVAWRAVVDSQLPAGLAGETWGRGGLFGAAPLTQGRTYWFAQCRAPEEPPVDAAREVEERFGGWSAAISQILEATPPASVIRTPFYEQPPLSSWTRGRVALMGDAAHPMLPNLGQGGGQAILDAASMAELLLGHDVAAELGEFERRRRGVATRAVSESKTMARLALIENPLGARVRNALMRATPARVSLRRIEQLVA